MTTNYRITFHHMTTGYDTQVNDLVFEVNSFESLSYSLNANDVTEATLVLDKNIYVPSAINSRGIVMRIWRKTDEMRSYYLEGSTDWLVMKVVETYSAGVTQNRQCTISAYHPNVVMARRVIAFPAKTTYADKISAWPEDTPSPNWDYPIALAKEYFRENINECVDVNDPGYNPTLETTLTSTLNNVRTELVEELPSNGSIIKVKNQVLPAPSGSPPVGGFIHLSAPTKIGTTVLRANVSSGATQINVADKIFSAQDRIYLQKENQLEHMIVTDDGNLVGNNWRYNVTRNADGTGADAWLTNDVIRFSPIYEVFQVTSAATTLPNDGGFQYSIASQASARSLPRFTWKDNSVVYVYASMFVNEKVLMVKGSKIYLMSGDQYENIEIFQDTTSTVAPFRYEILRNQEGAESYEWPQNSIVYHPTISTIVPIDVDRRISVSLDTPPPPPSSPVSSHYTESTSGYQNLLSTMQELSSQIDNQGNRHYFAFLTHAGRARLEIKRNYLNLDKSQDVFFGFKYGNIADIVVTSDYQKEINVVYAGGSGSEDAQLVRKVVFAKVNPYFRSEEFVTFGDVDSNSGLESEGRRYLYTNRAKKTIRAKVMDAGQFRYGKDYRHGDLVTLVFEGATYKCHIYGVSVSVSGMQESIDIYLDTQVNI